MDVVLLFSMVIGLLLIAIASVIGGLALGLAAQVPALTGMVVFGLVGLCSYVFFWLGLWFVFKELCNAIGQFNATDFFFLNAARSDCGAAGQKNTDPPVSYWNCGCYHLLPPSFKGTIATGAIMFHDRA